MTQRERARFRKKLKELESATLDAIRRKRPELCIQRAPDSFDEFRQVEDREIAVFDVHRHASLLRKVRLALSRINDHSFGLCARCEERLSKARLAAVPWAAFCVRCQEIIDLNPEEEEMAVGEYELGAA